MKTLIGILLTAFFLHFATANASSVSSTGQAISICKAEAVTNNPGYVRSKLKLIKETRKGYKLKLLVVLADHSVSSLCLVSRDGTIDYSQS